MGTTKHVLSQAYINLGIVFLFNHQHSPPRGTTNEVGHQTVFQKGRTVGTGEAGHAQAALKVS